MRLALLLLAALPLFAAVPEWTPMDPAERRAALAALNGAVKAGDWPAVMRLSEPLLAREPWIPALQLQRARAEAAGGDSRAALRRLGELAAAGHALDPAEDPLLAPLLTGPRGRALAARFARNRAPAGAFARVRDVAAGELLAEGLAFDGAAGRWFVGDVRGRRILAVDRAGGTTTFADRASGLWGVFALRVDAPRSRLWAVSAITPEMDGYDAAAEGAAALFEFNLADGALLARHDPPPGVKFLGDLALAPDGALWASDSLGGAVVRMPPGGELAVAIPAGRFHSPQGIAVSGDGARVWIADYRHGLFRFTPADGRLVHVGMKADQWLQGLDALALVDDRLVGVQNGAPPHRVIAIRLNRAGDAVERIETLAANLPGLAGPTQGIPCPCGYCLIAAGHWEAFESPGGSAPARELPALIVRVPTRAR